MPAKSSNMLEQKAQTVNKVLLHQSNDLTSGPCSNDENISNTNERSFTHLLHRSILNHWKTRPQTGSEESLK